MYKGAMDKAKGERRKVGSVGGWGGGKWRLGYRDKWTWIIKNAGWLAATSAKQFPFAFTAAALECPGILISDSCFNICVTSNNTEAFFLFLESCSERVQKPGHSITFFHLWVYLSQTVNNCQEAESQRMKKRPQRMAGLHLISHSTTQGGGTRGHWNPLVTGQGGRRKQSGGIFWTEWKVRRVDVPIFMWWGAECSALNRYHSYSNNVHGFMVLTLPQQEVRGKLPWHSKIMWSLMQKEKNLHWGKDWPLSGKIGAKHDCMPRLSFSSVNFQPFYTVT